MPPITQAHILAVDDELLVLEATENVLAMAGYEQVTCINDSRKVQAFLARQPVDLLLLDLNMPFISGQELLEHCADNYPQLPVVVITAVSDVTTAVQCVKAGAVDYLVKPIDAERLETTVAKALELAGLRRENQALQTRLISGALEHPEAFAKITTRTSAMLNLLTYAEAVAASMHPVLLLGETGTGKELLARAIHAASGRVGEFVAVNAAGLDDQAFADALFGHQAGAFTGADHARAGLVDAAALGTLFLDEIGDLSLASQVKLLRLLQDGDYRPLGADQARQATARFVVATNRDPKQMVEAGQFRKDLYFRLRTHELRLLPLRDRRDDIPLLVEVFIAETCAELGTKAFAAPPELLHLLAAYPFPGNIRELRGLLADAIIKNHGHGLDLSTIRDRLAATEGAAAAASETAAAGTSAAGAADDGAVVFPESMPTLKQLEELAFAEALRRAGGNQSRAARLLGISQPSVSKRMKRQQ